NALPLSDESLEFLVSDVVTSSDAVDGGDDEFATQSFAARFDERTSSAARPGPRSRASRSYDEARGALLLFGGATATGFSDELWQWDDRWARRTPAGPRPSNRAGAMMAYDGARGVSVLFGGDTGPGPSNDTWTWNGSQWREGTPAVSPPPRSDGALVYDPVRGETILFGGLDAQGQALGDTWRWDGFEWEELSAAGPSPRFFAATTYLPKENGILLFGGQDSPTNRLGDTWLWQNGAWSSPSTAINPLPRSKGALIYEASTERTILTGGRVNADQDFLWGGAGWEVLNLNSDAEFFESPFVGHHAGRGVTLYYSGADIFDFVDGLQDSQLRLEDDRWVADTSALPPKNRGHMFAYHDAAGTSVFYGGYVQDFGIVNELNDLWTWDGTVWRNIASAAPPPGGRHSAVFYYEPSRNALTLYDGASDEPVATHSLSFSTNTYAWSTSGNTGTVPGEQERYAGAYDAGRDRFYLFSDTLRVRSGGAFWSIAPVGRSTPSARSAAAMVYDELHDRLVMFGGEVAGVASDF
ncbi:MAG: kelch repeat-containing protein, partial [Myxococcota bacterium]